MIKCLRSSIYIEWYNVKIVIEVGSDFRMKMVQANFENLESILMIHADY